MATPLRSRVFRARRDLRMVASALMGRLGSPYELRSDARWPAVAPGPAQARRKGAPWVTPETTTPPPEAPERAAGEAPRGRIADEPGADAKGANKTGANATGANATGANGTGANKTGAKKTGPNATGAKPTVAKVTRMPVAAEVSVELEAGPVRFHVPAGMTLLEAAESAGVALPHSCAVGGCGACVCVVRAGSVHLPEDACLTDAERAAGLTLTCVGRPTARRVHLEPA